MALGAQALDERHDKHLHARAARVSHAGAAGATLLGVVASAGVALWLAGNGRCIAWLPRVSCMCVCRARAVLHDSFTDLLRRRSSSSPWSRLLKSSPSVAPSLRTCTLSDPAPHIVPRSGCSCCGTLAACRHEVHRVGQA